MSEENRKKYSKFVSSDEENYQKMKKIMINDKSMTEYFIQSFILHSCNIILIVVEMLTYQDQKIIERIKTMYSGLKNIIVVHNFFKLEAKEQVRMKAISDIKGAFDVIDGFIPESDVPYFIERTSKNNINILHLILGRDGYESGDFFNQVSIDQITKTIATFINLEKFDVFNKINEFWQQRNGIYFNCFREEPELPIFVMKNKNKKTFIKLNFKKKLELKTPEFDVLGGLKNLEIVYHLYRITHPKIEKIYYFELPGLTEIPEDIGFYPDKISHEQFLVLNIVHMSNSPEGYKCIEGELPNGKYPKRIKISDEFGYYCVDKTFTNLKNGILQMKFVLRDDYEIINKQ